MHCIVGKNQHICGCTDYAQTIGADSERSKSSVILRLSEKVGRLLLAAVKEGGKENVMSKEDDLKELACLRDQLAKLDPHWYEERLAGITIQAKIKELEDRWPIAWCSQCGSPINNCEFFRGPVCPKCGHWT